MLTRIEYRINKRTEHRC